MVLNHPHQFKRDRYSFIKSTRANAVFSQLPVKFTHPCSVQFRLGDKGGTDFSQPDRLPYTQNSPYVAIGLAVLMGANQIGLIGVDFTDNHFFAKTGSHPLARKIFKIDNEYKKLSDALKITGIELVNLSPTSLLKSLKKVAIDDFLNQQSADIKNGGTVNLTF